jgi:hypothetical protein
VLLEVAGDFIKAITEYHKPPSHDGGNVAINKTYR